MKSAPSADLVEQVSHEDDRNVSTGGFNFAGLWTLYVLTVRQHLHGKRWMVMAVLFLLPAGLAILVRATDPDVPSIELEFDFAFMFIPQALLPLVALLYASGMIRDEQEEQTITYLLIRPISKWALYGIKVLATLTTTVALTAVFTVLTYAAIYLGADSGGENIPLRCLKAVAIHSLAVGSYCCLFGLMSLMTRWILVGGIFYTALFEALIGNLPFSIRMCTIIYFSRVIAFRSLDFITPTPQGKHNIAADVWQFDLRKDPNLLEHPQLWTCVTVLLVASLLFSLFAAFLCSRREFYVKTPDRN